MLVPRNNRLSKCKGLPYLRPPTVLSVDSIFILLSLFDSLSLSLPSQFTALLWLKFWGTNQEAIMVWMHHPICHLVLEGSVMRSVGAGRRTMLWSLTFLTSPRLVGLVLTANVFGQCGYGAGQRLNTGPMVSICPELSSKVASAVCWEGTRQPATAWQW